MRKFAEFPARKRIVVYFVLVIVLPSAIMGILAFRGVKNDQALIAQDNRRRVFESGQQLITYTDAILADIDSALAKVAIHRSVPIDEAFFHDTVLVDFIRRFPAVRGILYHGRAGIQMLDYPLQFLPMTAIPPAAQPAAEMRSILDLGWKYEFQERDYTRALDLYQSLDQEAMDSLSGAHVVNVMARLQRKTGQIVNALESYALLADKYPGARIERIPAGLIADAQRCELLLLQSDTLGAIRAWSQLLFHLLEPRWKIDGGTYALFVSEAGELLKALLYATDSGSTWLKRLDSLYVELLRRQTETESLFILHDDIEHYLDNTAFPRRWRAAVLGLSYLVSSFIDSSGYQWMAVISEDTLLHHLLVPRLSSMSQDGRWIWEMRNANGDILIKTGDVVATSDAVEIAFPPHLPDWTLVAYAKPPTLFQAFFRSGRGIYFYLFIFIGAILITGLLFVYYSVNRELTLTKLKSDFIATVAHELKSPLTSIRQITEMLQSGRVPGERRDRYYTIMLQQGARLTHQIDNILDFTKIEQGAKRYNLAKSDVVAIIRRIVDTHNRGLVDIDKQIHLLVKDEIPEIVVDGPAIEQALNNLLDNAIKFSDKSQRIEVETYIEQDSLVIRVRDYGIGIPQKEQARIFDRFYRAEESHGRIAGGSGIGLSLVKEIMAAHGGSVRVESQPGEGSIFYLYLPLANQQNIEENSDHRR